MKSSRKPKREFPWLSWSIIGCIILNILILIAPNARHFAFSSIRGVFSFIGWVLWILVFSALGGLVIGFGLTMFFAKEDKSTKEKLKLTEKLLLLLFALLVTGMGGFLVIFICHTASPLDDFRDEIRLTPEVVEYFENHKEELYSIAENPRRLAPDDDLWIIDPGGVQYRYEAGDPPRTLGFLVYRSDKTDVSRHRGILRGNHYEYNLDEHWFFYVVFYGE